MGLRSLLTHSVILPQEPAASCTPSSSELKSRWERAVLRAQDVRMHHFP